VVVVALGAAGALVVARRGDGARVEAEVALSNAGLDPAGAAGSGVAELTVRDGRYELVVRLSNVAAPGDAYLELWLIDRSVEGLVSLGPYHGDGGYPLPASVAPGAFPVVDVSIEPVDGAPTHSGRSVLRGVLEL
ncbi:MAG: anti-sigma factor, partial [Acidimicrobiales bacterium]